MASVVRASRPRIDAHMQFNLMMELYDKGRGMDTAARIEAINKFLTVSQPGVENQIRWSWFSKTNTAERIVSTLRWGLHQLRDGKPFMRSGPPITGLPVLLEQDRGFEDGIVWDRYHARIARVGARDTTHMFVTRVFELLTEVAPWLRVCQREECKRFYLFERPKQIYCSDVCAQRVRMARFLARRKPKLPTQRAGRK